MKSIGVEESAFLLAWEGVVSALVNWSWLRSRRSTGNYVIDATVVVTQLKGSSVPCPLESVLAIGEMWWNCDGSSARIDTAIGTIGIASQRVAWIGRSATHFVATVLLNSSIEGTVTIGLIECSPSQTDESTSVIVSRPLNGDWVSSCNGDCRGISRGVFYSVTRT